MLTDGWAFVYTAQLRAMKAVKEGTTPTFSHAAKLSEEYLKAQQETLREASYSVSSGQQLATRLPWESL